MKSNNSNSSNKHDSSNSNNNSKTNTNNNGNNNVVVNPTNSSNVASLPRDEDLQGLFDRLKLTSQSLANSKYPYQQEIELEAQSLINKKKTDNDKGKSPLASSSGEFPSIVDFNKTKNSAIPSNKNSSDAAGAVNDKLVNRRCFGLIPTKWANVFLAPLICVIILILAAIGVSIAIYYVLHNRELDEWRKGFSLQCEQRANLIQSGFVFALAAMKSLGSFQAVQQHYSLNHNLTLSQEDFRDYIESSGIPVFLDQLVWIPKILDQDRASFESRSGHPISDIVCAPGYVLFVNCTDATLTTAPIAKSEFYYPYEYYHPFTFANGQHYRNLDGYNSFILGARPAIEQTLIKGDLFFSARTGLAASSYSIRNEFGLVASLPVFYSGFNVTLNSNNFSTNLVGNRGIVLAAIRVSLIAYNAISDLRPLLPMIFSMYDKTATDARIPGFLFQINPANVEMNDIDFKENTTAVFAQGGRQYSLVCSPTDQFINQAYSSTPLIIAIGVAVIIALNMMFLVVGLLILNTRRVLHRAEILSSANEHKSIALGLLAEAKELADRANKSKSDFLAFLCHELRNPLHAISAMVEFLGTSNLFKINKEFYLANINNPSSDNNSNTSNYIAAYSSITQKQREAAEYISVIDAQVSMMRSIIDDCLDMSKIEAGVLQFECLGFDLMRLCKNLINSMKAKAHAKGIALKLKVAREKLPRKVYSDPTRLRQLILNLLTNAIKFTDKGFVELKLTAKPIINGKTNSNSKISKQSINSSTESKNVPPPPNISTRPNDSVINTNIPLSNTNNIINLTNNINIVDHDHISLQINDAKASSSNSMGNDANAAILNNNRYNINDLGVIDENRTNTNTDNSADPNVKSTNTVLPPETAVENESMMFEITVRDTGSGIAASAIPHLFEPYSQEKLSIMRTHGGTGLGLSIVDKILTHMGGEIRVISTVGKGSAFIIRIPLPIVNPHKKAAPDQETGQLLNSNETITSPRSYIDSSAEESSNPSHGTNTASKSSKHTDDPIISRSASHSGIAQFNHTSYPTDSYKFLDNPPINNIHNNVDSNNNNETKMNSFRVHEENSDSDVRVVRFNHKSEEIEIINQGNNINHQHDEKVESYIDPKHYTHEFSLLLVDDNPINLKILSKMIENIKLSQPFENIKITIETADDGQIAIDKIKQRLDNFNDNPQYSTILLDIIMPNLDGLSAAKKIRELELAYHLPPVPLISLTANAMQRDRQAAATAGFNFFLPKPFKAKQIQHLLQQAFTIAITNNNNHNNITLHQASLDESNSFTD